MNSTYFYAFGSVIAVSLISLIGAFLLSIKEKTLRRYIFVFISLAIGALLGDAFIHLIPEAIRRDEGGILTSLLIISGIFIFFAIEKFLHWHHHAEEEDIPRIHPMGKLVLFSDGIHNFTDGIIIGASFLVSVPVGLASTVAVVLHEIPQEIGDFAVLLHSGFARGRALWLNFLSALVAVLGTATALFFGQASESFVPYILPAAAGGFIYIALADLIPELQKTKKPGHSLLQLLSVIVGILLMLALLLLE